jgi:hypothetical protein
MVSNSQSTLEQSMILVVCDTYEPESMANYHKIVMCFFTFTLNYKVINILTFAFTFFLKYLIN